MNLISLEQDEDAVVELATFVDHEDAVVTVTLKEEMRDKGFFSAIGVKLTSYSRARCNGGCLDGPAICHDHHHRRRWW